MYYIRMQQSEWKRWIFAVTLLFSLSLSIFYTLGFIGHQKNVFETRIRSANTLFEALVERKKETIRQGYFVWTSIVAALDAGDKDFLDSNYLEMKEHLGVIGLSVRKDGREVYRNGISFFTEHMFTRSAGVLVGIFSLPVKYDGGEPSPYTARLMFETDSIKEIIDPIFEDLPPIRYGTSGIPVYKGNFFVTVPTGWDFFLKQPIPIVIVNSLILLLLLLSNLLSRLAIKWTGVESKLDHFVALVEQRDSFAVGHTARVFFFADQFAGKLHFSRQRRKLLHAACLAHDIGKLVIPEQVLNKPGPLEKEEYELIKQHPVTSKELFHGISPNKTIEAAVICHHEWWNGRGYPYGLSGEAIPPEARIIAIADVLDALTSDRAYRPAHSRDEAMKIIRENSGTQFDPELVELLPEIIFPEHLV